MSHTYPSNSDPAADIITIGFEGPNRVGKGTQCTLLQRWLAERGVPALIVRGDGSRSGIGQSWGDPPSPLWQDLSAWLHTPNASYEDWNRAAYRLARELRVWRDRIMPRWVETNHKSLGVLIVDRSLLSRTMVPRAMGLQDIPNHLYPESARGKGQRVTAEAVCPELILNLIAPKAILLSRLSGDDPKYAFRKTLIEQSCDWYQEAPQFIPARLRSRVLEIDANQEIDEVFETILGAVLRISPRLSALEQVEARQTAMSIPAGVLQG